MIPLSTELVIGATEAVPIGLLVYLRLISNVLLVPMTPRGCTQSHSNPVLRAGYDKPRHGFKYVPYHRPIPNRHACYEVQSPLLPLLSIVVV